MIDSIAYHNAAPQAGIRSRIIDGINGLRMHILEAGYDQPGRPCVLLLHGFPELAYSWRKIMPDLAEAGYYVVAPDQRGYGLTTGWDGDYDGDLASFRPLNIVRDALALVQALGHSKIAAVIGHDFGSPIAAWCALVRPDVFQSVVLMSAPFSGPPKLPFSTAGDIDPAGHPKATPTGLADASLHADLAALDRPRKHYQWYYSTRNADADMRLCPQGIHAFMRAYYHMKSADWPGNNPFPLMSWKAAELAKLPTYYVMDAARTMAQTVLDHEPSADQITACDWLPEKELNIYSAAFARTGFQGSLQWYRCGLNSELMAELQLFSGRTIDVPSCFIAGANDWGIHQIPGSLEQMQTAVCTDFRGSHFIENAGHWVQQERPQEVKDLLLKFLREQ